MKKGRERRGSLSLPDGCDADTGGIIPAGADGMVKAGLFLDVRLFQSEVAFLVDHLQDETDDEGDDTQSGKHDQRCSVIELCRVGHTDVRLVEHLA